MKSDSERLMLVIVSCIDRKDSRSRSNGEGRQTFQGMDRIYQRILKEALKSKNIDACDAY